jgi:holo-[acyl-carrier protein] synthase
MIIGIGTDIINIQRIEKAINNFGDKFLQKIFTEQEINRCKPLKNSSNSFAKIFAGKEAIVKAIGFTEGISWQDIEIFKDNNGKPYFKLYKKALENLKSISGVEKFDFHLSLSDDYPQALAFAIISCNAKLT